MPRLVLFTSLMRDLRDGDTAELSCTLKDQLLFSHRIGEGLLIANTDPRLEPGYVASGRLAGFSNAGGQTRVRVDTIRPLLRDVPLKTPPPQGQALIEMPEELFDDIIALSIAPEGADEAPAIFLAAPVAADLFTEQLRRQQDGRCCFSGAPKPDGKAVMIRPLYAEGPRHVTNFLFIDPELGQLFANFAWTVGPRFEIIIDAHAVPGGLVETVNHTGMLAISERVGLWPDRAALAWHFERFVERLQQR